MQDGVAKGADKYELVRPSDKMTTTYALYGEMGAQSTILVAATYTNLESHGTVLTRKNLYPALRKLISQHWALREVVVEKPSGEKHQFWDAQVHTIDLDRIVIFDEIDDSNGITEYLQGVHNEWLDTRGNTSDPFWRLKVVNGKHAVFAFHHALADGLSGYAFHKGLLKLLNEPTAESGIAVFNPPKVEPVKSWLTDFPATVSMVQLLWDVVYMYFIRFWFKGSIMFDDLPVATSPPPLSDRTIGHTKRCRTSLRTLRIPAALQSQLVDASRRHGVTFGTLLHTISVMTMATELYPRAKLALTSMPISLRSLTDPPQSPDLITNTVGAHMRARRLEPYRAAAASTNVDAGRHIDPARTWALTRSYRQELLERVDSRAAINGSLAIRMFDNDLETVYKRYFPALWLYQRYFTSVSNLGAFAPEAGTWTISDIQFSAAALKTNFGFVAPVFNVAAIRGGDCVISCVMQEGLLEPSVIEGMLEGMLARLKLLAKLEDAEAKS